MTTSHLLKLIPILFLLISSSMKAQDIEATVSDIDPDARTFTLEAISSQENAAPLVVVVGPGDAQLNYKGKRIRGTLSKSDGKAMLETIWPADPQVEKTMNAVNLFLRQDTAYRKRQAFRKENDTGINFAMFNEHGESVQWDQYKGKWIIMNFIFTRCRMPKMCPAQTARMIDLQRHAQTEGISNLQQLSVTFDPAYDTPGVLFDYATSRGADLSTFSFLTGTNEVMLDVLKQYGVIAFESKNIIDHTVTTLLFDKTGTIVLRRDGTEWNEADFVQHILDAEKAEAASAAIVQPTTDPTLTEANGNTAASGKKSPLIPIAIALLSIATASLAIGLARVGKK